jgi:hypothetical protein
MDRRMHAGVKLVLAVVGLVLFFAGVRLDYAAVRWAGIAVVACAFLLRFVPSDDPSSGQETAHHPPPDES